MKISLIGAELEENLGLRYMASALEVKGHQVNIISYNNQNDIPEAVKQVRETSPAIVGLSMVFTSRAMEFIDLARALRDDNYRNHIIAGGPFASFNGEQLLKDYPVFDSIGLGEGEELICKLAENIDNISEMPGLCFRDPDGQIATNPSISNPEKLDLLPFPKRTSFHDYFDKPIASILSSRGCWRNCAFCSINAWYERGGGRKFRLRSIDNIIAEMKELYFDYNVRIFNFQDDNFFHPKPDIALSRFKELSEGLRRAGVDKMAIAIKARPDSITRESVEVLDDLGLFRVFLGVENASERGLRNLNRKCSYEQILNSLEILNAFDVHVAFNLLMFEPDTILDDILINLRFIEQHIENPFNFCRAEVHTGTGLEDKLKAEGRLLGDYFGHDYRLKDPYSEAFHKIANYAFFERNFSDFGLHYFNMQVDFCFQLLRRFHPELLTQSLRASARNFIKETNLDTYDCLCQIYDFVKITDPVDQVRLKDFARRMRVQVDQRSQALHERGKYVLQLLEKTYGERGRQERHTAEDFSASGLPLWPCRTSEYYGSNGFSSQNQTTGGGKRRNALDIFGVEQQPIPYHTFKKSLNQK
jgi:radical SAM superfamily enzyme YgiQ (UPF0313 family)